MDNPKIKIESDGNFVQIYINGKKISNRVTDFNFHVDVINGVRNINWYGNIIKLGENGKCIFENGEPVTAKFHFDNHETEE